MENKACDYESQKAPQGPSYLLLENTKSTLGEGSSSSIWIFDVRVLLVGVGFILLLMSFTIPVNQKQSI